MTEDVAEVTEVVTSAPLLKPAPAPSVGDWVVVTTQADARFGEESWTDLRERMAAPIVAEIRSRSEDVRREAREIASLYETTLLRRLRRTHPWLIDDMSGDLINVARARLLGEPSPFFEALFLVYRHGGVPARWSGEYPEGKLVALFAEA